MVISVIGRIGRESIRLVKCIRRLFVWWKKFVVILMNVLINMVSVMVS